MSAVILQNEVVHYEVLGRGRPVLFLHSWVGSWRYWIPAMQAASIAYRAYALDFWGFGDTAKNPERYGVEDQTELVAGFLEHMGIAKVAIMGHGLGALAGVNFAAKHPDMVDRMVTIGLPVSGVNLNGRLANDLPRDLADWLIREGEPTDAVRVDAPKTEPAAIQLSLRRHDPVELLQTVSTLSTPTVLVYGMNDPALALASPDQFLIDLPDHMHVILFEQSGHFPMRDEATKFNRLMTDFFLLKSGESPRQLQLKEEWKRRVR